MKKTFKVFGSLLLATSLIFGVVSCDNASKGVDGTGVESGTGSEGGTETLGKTEVVTNGSVGEVSTSDDVAELVCEDENGGKYGFTQKLSVENQRTAASVGGTWKYYLKGVLKYSGTFEGDIYFPDFNESKYDKQILDDVKTDDGYHYIQYLYSKK